MVQFTSGWIRHAAVILLSPLRSPAAGSAGPRPAASIHASGSAPSVHPQPYLVARVSMSSTSSAAPMAARPEDARPFTGLDAVSTCPTSAVQESKKI